MIVMHDVDDISHYPNYCKGRKTIDGRIFEIEFWTSYMVGVDLRWCRVCEIRQELRPIHWLSRQKEMREVRYEVVSRFWTDGDRLSTATKKIKEYIQSERDLEEERRRVEAFCAQTNKANETEV